jgi:hypothetical protein
MLRTHWSYSLCVGSSPWRSSQATSRKVGLLGELFDRVAAVAQDAAIAVDERDRALARRGVHEGGIVRHQPELVGRGLDLAKVHRTRGSITFDAALNDLDRIILAGAGVFDVECSRRLELPRRRGRWGIKRRLCVGHAHVSPKGSLQSVSALLRERKSKMYRREESKPLRGLCGADAAA